MPIVLKCNRKKERTSEKNIEIEIEGPAGLEGMQEVLTILSLNEFLCAKHQAINKTSRQNKMVNTRSQKIYLKTRTKNKKQNKKKINETKRK